LRRRKSFIKDNISPDFLLEWFLKSLFPYISKYVSTSGVTTEEEAIFKAQQLDFIYSKYGILYEIIHETPRYNTYFFELNPRPIFNGVLGSLDTPTIESLSKNIDELLVNQSTVDLAKASTPSPCNVNLYSSQSIQKGTQHPNGKKNKGKEGDGN